MASHSCTLMSNSTVELISWIETCWYKSVGLDTRKFQEGTNEIKKIMNIAEKDQFVKENQTPDPGPNGPFLIEPKLMNCW